jgi:hypothetical protein
MRHIPDRDFDIFWEFLEIMRRRFDEAKARSLGQESRIDLMRSCFEGYDNQYLKKMYDTLEWLSDEAIPYEMEQALIRSRGRKIVSEDYLFSASLYLVSLGREAWLRARHDISVIPEGFDWARYVPIADAIISHFSDQGLDVDTFDGG